MDGSPGLLSVRARSPSHSSFRLLNNRPETATGRLRVLSECVTVRVNRRLVS